MFKTFLLSAVLVACAGLGMAQNCVSVNTCHIDQTSDTQVVTENQQNVCVFNFVAPEIITVTCRTSRVLHFTATLAFVIGGCQDGNYLGDTDIHWKFCRTGDSVFSWEVDDDTSFTKSGSLF